MALTSAAPSSGTVFVTGGSGQIGHFLLQRLAWEGRPCVALRRMHPVPAAPGIAVVRGDLADPHFDDIVQERVGALIHTAALWLLPERLEAFRSFGVERLICFSSTSIIGKRDTHSADERRLVARLLEAEATVTAQCSKLGIAWTILRPTMIYGLGVDRNVARAARFIERFGFYPVATGAAGQRQPVHADDLAGAILLAIDNPRTHGRLYDVGGGERLGYRSFVARIFDALGLPRRIVPVPGLAAAVGLAARVRPGASLPAADMVRRMRQDLVCDNGPAAADFGYAPRQFLAAGRDDLFGRVPMER